MANPQAHHSNGSFSISSLAKHSVTVEFNAGSTTMRKVGCIGDQLLDMEIIQGALRQTQCALLFLCRSFVSRGHTGSMTKMGM